MLFESYADEDDDNVDGDLETGIPCIDSVEVVSITLKKRKAAEVVKKRVM